MSLAPARAAEIESWLGEARAWTDRELDRLLPPVGSEPRRVHEAMRYAVFGGGKRLRPAIVRLVAAHCGGTEREAALVAAAVECVHTYSLVHDDLPCMDDDDLRRGRPTVHRAYGEAVAVLAGDALLTHAFQLLARSGPLAGELVGVLADAAGAAGMVGGQDLDLGATRAGAPTSAEVARIHELKTAALIAASAEMGAIAARSRPTERIAAQAYGLALGRCFQAVDDILDVTGDAATLGKTPGKDQAAGKATLVAVLGLDGARQRARELAAEARRAAEGLGAVKGDLAYDLVAHLLERRA
ncbi:MAG: polyprenyl synthetase family protein [Planctomycetes bacterium]|nr:polyprenyl synthetase family protein [Planctomycetota bacterium]